MQKLNDNELLYYFRECHSSQAFFLLKEKYQNLIKKITRKYFYKFRNSLPFCVEDIFSYMEYEFYTVCNYYNYCQNKVLFIQHLYTMVKHKVLYYIRIWISKNQMFLTRCNSIDYFYKYEHKDNINLTPEEKLIVESENEIKKQWILKKINNIKDLNKKNVFKDYFDGLDIEEISEKYKMEVKKVMYIIRYCIFKMRSEYLKNKKIF